MWRENSFPCLEKPNIAPYMKQFSSVHFLICHFLKKKVVLCGRRSLRFCWFHYYIFYCNLVTVQMVSYNSLDVAWFKVFTALLNDAVKTLNHSLNVAWRHEAGNFQREFRCSALRKVLWSQWVQFAVNGQTELDRRLIMWLTPWRKIMGEYFWIRRAPLLMFYIGFINTALSESKKKL